MEKRRLRGGLITVFQYLKGGYKEDGGSLFTRSHMEKTRGNGYKLHQERGFTSIQDRYCLGFFYSENNHWNSLPRDAVESPSLEVFKMQLDRVLDNPI